MTIFVYNLSHEYSCNFFYIIMKIKNQENKDGRLWPLIKTQMDFVYFDRPMFFLWTNMYMSCVIWTQTLDIVCISFYLSLNFYNHYIHASQKYIFLYIYGVLDVLTRLTKVTTRPASQLKKPTLTPKGYSYRRPKAYIHRQIHPNRQRLYRPTSLLTQTKNQNPVMHKNLMLH